MRHWLVGLEPFIGPGPIVPNEQDKGQAAHNLGGGAVTRPLPGAVIGGK